MTDTHSHSHLWPGVPLALGSATLFGATLPLSKVLLGVTQPFILAGLLYLGTGIGLGVYSSITRNRAQHKEARMAIGDLPWLALATAMGGIIGPVLLMLGLTLTTASNGSLLLNLEGLATMAIAWLAYRENVDRSLLFGAFAILLGAMLLSWEGQGLVFNTGALLVAGACMAWGLDNNFTRHISATDPVTIATIKGLVAGTVNLGLGLYAGGKLPDYSVVLAAGALGFFGIGVSLVFFILALRHLGTARTGAYYSLAPFIGAILAIFLLGEPLTIKLVAAAGFMGLGLWLHLSERHEHDHEHDALEHDHAHKHDEHHSHSHDVSSDVPHSHFHRHEPMRHKHPHFPDLHHRHPH